MTDIGKNLKTQMGKEFSNELGNVLGNNSPNLVDFIQSSNSAINSIGTNEAVDDETIIKRKIKKSDITNMVGNKKMKLPIGKLFSAKGETKEATSAGSAGGFVPPMVMSKKEMMEKWSDKYKKSIDCNNPKGFSQKAHCQGKKKKEQTNESEFKAPKLTMFSNEAPKKNKKTNDIKKVEAKEATGSASSGSYVTTAAWAKSMNKKDWRGKSKTLFPGGKFAQVKKECKTFPYCNQGDINALNLTNEEKISRVIKSLSKKYNITEDSIKKMLLKEYYKEIR